MLFRNKNKQCKRILDTTKTKRWKSFKKRKKKDRTLHQQACFLTSIWIIWQRGLRKIKMNCLVHFFRINFSQLKNSTSNIEVILSLSQFFKRKIDLQSSTSGIMVSQILRAHLLRSMKVVTFSSKISMKFILWRFLRISKVIKNRLQKVFLKTKIWTLILLIRNLLYTIWAAKISN